MFGMYSHLMHWCLTLCRGKKSKLYFYKGPSTDGAKAPCCYSTVYPDYIAEHESESLFNRSIYESCIIWLFSIRLENKALFMTYPPAAHRPLQLTSLLLFGLFRLA